MKQGVIFDLDGTLVNSLPDIAAAMNRALAKHGLPTHEEERYKYMVGNGVLNLARRAVGDCQESYQAVLDTYREDYARNCRVVSCPYEGISQLLDGLVKKGMKVCVFSNKDHQDVLSVVKHYFPAVPFAAIRGRMENVPIKPAPDGALLIARELGVAPQDFWYVGDTNTDMACGNAAGMATVGVLWGFRKRDELEAAQAKRIIAHPLELLQFADEE